MPVRLRRQIHVELNTEIMKKRNLFMSTTLMAACSALAFTFNDEGIHWIWANNKPVAVVLALLAITLGICWAKATKRVHPYG